jgi:autotransporter adhesin
MLKTSQLSVLAIAVTAANLYAYDIRTLASANNYTSQAVTTERNNRIAADRQLDSRINQEVADRASADRQLDTRINQEVADRASADRQLNTRINQEMFDRYMGDARTLASANNYTSQAVTTERNNRIAANYEAAVDRARIRDELNAGDARSLAQSKAYTDQSFNKLETRYQAAVASSMAIASLPQPTEAGFSMISMSVGQWESEQGYAVGISGITDSNKWVYKAAGTANSRGNFGGSMSFGYQWK